MFRTNKPKYDPDFDFWISTIIGVLTILSIVIVIIKKVKGQ